MLRYFTSRLFRAWSGSREKPELSTRYVDRASGLPLADQVRSLRQGDVFSITALPILWDHAGEAECPFGAVVVSQTCDLVRESVAEAQVSPVVTLSGNLAKEARAHRRPRYAPLSALGNEYFADLSVISTVHKSLLLSCDRQPGIAVHDWLARVDFSRAIGRKFDRYAFPDDVTPWLRPLQELMQSRAPKAGPVGQLADEILELRLEASEGWDAEPPYDLTLIVIVKASALPTVDDEVDLPELNLSDSETLPQAAAKRPAEDAKPEQVIAFWGRIEGALERLCRPPGNAPESVRLAVRSLAVEIVAEDDLKYSRALRSVEIDLDHLSAPPYFGGGGAE
jgi:hypothetical protein